jgi:hypothetical protein
MLLQKYSPMEDSKLLYMVISGFAAVTGSMALIIITWVARRIDKIEEQGNANAIAVGKAIDEPRVRDILHEELSDIRATTKASDEKLTQLMMANLQQKPTVTNDYADSMKQLTSCIVDAVSELRNKGNQA